MQHELPKWTLHKKKLYLKIYMHCSVGTWYQCSTICHTPTRNLLLWKQSRHLKKWLTLSNLLNFLKISLITIVLSINLFENIYILVI